MVPLGLLLWRAVIKPLVDWFKGAKKDKTQEDDKAGEKTPPPDSSDTTTTVTSSKEVDDKQSLRFEKSEREWSGNCVFVLLPQAPEDLNCPGGIHCSRYC